MTPERAFNNTLVTLAILHITIHHLLQLGVLCLRSSWASLGQQSGLWFQLRDWVAQGDPLALDSAVDRCAQASLLVRSSLGDAVFTFDSL